MIALATSIPAHSQTNIDPLGVDAKYAYAENLGWINLKPDGALGSGVVVGDFSLAGWMWSENAGWIALSCVNRGTCGAAAFEVTNDGQGHLAGFAWSENLGWVNFKPSSAGVMINPTSGDFSGRAWSENAGWITFSSSGVVPFNVTTSWRCPTGTTHPGAVSSLDIQKSGILTILSWGVVATATAFDVVSGDLGSLRSSGGDYSLATQSCVSRKQPGTTLAVNDSPGPGAGYWYLVRAANCGGAGTYDETGFGQQASRDAEILASGADCP